MVASENYDEYDELFDADDDASYTEEVEAEEGESTNHMENVAELFGDVGDLSEEEENVQKMPPSLPVDQEKRSKQDLEGL